MQEQQHGAHGATPVRALLADDSPIMVRALVSLLKSIEGVVVDAIAYDGAQAVEKAAEVEPDLVLLDYRMPRLDGLEAATRIRDAVPDAKILILSLHDQDAVREEAEARSDGFVSKADLRERLSPLLAELFPERVAPKPARRR